MTKDTETLRMLYAQIEDIYRQFKDIRTEASGIVENSQMPDATSHLNNVLEATEQATHTILDAATTIGTLAETTGVPAEVGQKITAQLVSIYEACSFQDISGQRIKKVLRHIRELEEKLHYLADAARGQSVPVKKTDSLLNGPALSSEAPDQEQIDAMFREM